ncbi:MAG: hypothetical protein PVJ09_02540 [Candidatus Woesebacteria bacterium]|jgi:hypothetical protein
MKQPLFIKEKTHLLDLLKDLGETTEQALALRQQDANWLQFAKRKDHGYKFLEGKEEQVQFLEDIAKEVSARHENYSLNQVVDILSNLVNTTVRDAVFLAGLIIAESLLEHELNHLERQLIQVVKDKSYVPRYPWLLTVPSEDKAVEAENQWRAKDLSRDQELKISKKKDDDFHFYEITYV